MDPAAAYHAGAVDDRGRDPSDGEVVVRWTLRWRRIVVAGALASCGAPADPGVPGGVSPPSSTPDTPPIDTGDAPETGEPTVDDPTGDSDPPPIVPWGAGFVDVTGGLGAAPLVVDPGSRADDREAQSVRAFWGDLDGDGVDEVVVAAPWTSDTPSSARSVAVGRWTPAGTIERAPELEARLRLLGGAPVAAVDLDGDGLTELIGDRHPDTVLWGGASAPTSILPDTASNARLSLAWIDLDRDGWLDLVVSPDRCGGPPTPLYRTGPRRFAARADLVAPLPSVSSTSVFSGVLADGTQLHLDAGDPCTRTDPPPGFLVVDGEDASGRPTWAGADLTPSDMYWKLTPATAGGPINLVAPMGAALGDLDADGRTDLLVSVGVPRQALLRGLGGGRFEDRSTGRLAAAMTPFPTPEFPWGVLLPDLDQDGRPDVVWAAGDDGGSFMREQGHPLPIKAFRNLGGWDFEDVSAEVGLGQRASWRSIGWADPDGDGDADLVVGGHGVQPLVLRNDVDVGHRGISIVLRGTSSNPLGVGAVIEARVAGLPPQQAIHGMLGNPDGLSAPISFVGAGRASTVERLTVRWPSGVVQTLTDLAVGQRHTITEPVLVEGLGAQRSVPVGGTRSLRITPRTADGRPVVGATVTARMVGDGAVQSVADLGGVWGVLIQAPGVAGEGALVITVDGVTLPARPRVWFVAP